MICDQCHLRCGEICAIKPDMCECVFTPVWDVGDEGMTLLNSCQGAKELWPNFEFLNLKENTIPV